jgi:antitoxin (DNA-binding transcriptional repressor) of toxin-antitoxin stability system
MGASEAADQAAKAEQQGRILKVELEEAAGRLPDLVNRVRRGEDVVLSDGELEVRLVLLPPGRRVLGQDAGLFEIPEDFDEPLPDALLDAFGS